MIFEFPTDNYTNKQKATYVQCLVAAMVTDMETIKSDIEGFEGTTGPVPLSVSHCAVRTLGLCVEARRVLHEQGPLADPRDVEIVAKIEFMGQMLGMTIISRSEGVETDPIGTANDRALLNTLLRGDG